MILGADIEAAEGADVDLPRRVGVEIALVVVVQDLVQRAEDELHVSRIGRVRVLELDARRVAAQVVRERVRRAEFDEGLRVGVAGRAGVARLEVQGPVAHVVDHGVERIVAGFRRRKAVDGVIDDAEVGRPVAQGGNASRDGGVVDDGRVRERAAIADGADAPGEEVLVDVVGIELRVQRRQVEFEAVARPELDPDVAARAHAVLLEKGRADEGGREDVGDARARISVDRKVAQHLDAVAADLALLVGAGEQDPEVFGLVLPAEQQVRLRRRLVGEIGVSHLRRAVEGH